jgi:hypothetical protein
MTRREELIRQARADLESTVASLGIEETIVLAHLARRLMTGQQTYGHMQLAVDRRDFERERGNELADALVYTAMAELKRLLLAPGGTT